MEKGQKKKVKLSAIEINASSKSKIHNDNISKVVWASTNRIISGSYDHSIKIFDVEKLNEVKTFACKDSIVSSLLYQNSFILSGHEDGYIKSWDQRLDNNVPNQIYKSHSVWISDLKQNPFNEFIFASVRLKQ